MTTKPPTTLSSILVPRLRALLRDKRANPTQVTRDAGLQKGAVRAILNGDVKNPRTDTLDKIARTLGTDVGYLLGEHDNVTVPPRAADPTHDQQRAADLARAYGILAQPLGDAATVIADLIAKTRTKP